MASIWCLVICVWILGASANIDETFEMFPNIGVAIEQIGAIQTTTSYWHHVIVKPLPKPEDFLPTGNTSDPQLEYLAQMAQELQDLAKLRLPNLSDELKRQRTARVSFGMATVKDVIKIRDAVDNLTKNHADVSKQISHSTEKMVSFARETNEIMIAMESMLQTNQEMNESVTYNISKVSSLEEWMEDMLENMRKREAAFMDIRDAMVRSSDAIGELSRGELSDNTISDEDLLLAFNVVKKVQAEMGDTSTLLETDPGRYYNHAKFFAFLNGSDIWVTLRLPLGDQRPADLYRIHTWDVPVYNGSSHSTQIQGLPEYAVVYGSGIISTVGLSAEDINTCVGEQTYICPFTVYYTKLKDSSSCLSAILGGSSEGVHARCDFILKPNTIQPLLKQISTNKVLIQGISSLTIKCGRQSVVHQGCHSCIFEIPCGCRIIANKQLYIVSTQVGCSRVDSQVKRTDMVNFHVLKHFLNDSLAARVLLQNELDDDAKLSKMKFKELDAYIKEISNKELLVKKTIRDILKETEINERQVNEPAYSTTPSWNASFDKKLSLGMSLFALILLVGLIISLVCCWLKYRKQRKQDTNSMKPYYLPIKSAKLTLLQPHTPV